MVITTFGYITGFIALFMVVSTVLQFHRKKITASWALFWSGLWIIGAVAVFFSGWLDKVSFFLIKDNGAQLIIYFAILFLFFLCYRLFLAVQQLNEAISKLVEELAKK